MGSARAELPHPARRPGWALLVALLLALVAAATIDHRADWPRLLAGEATYLMQAESLAYDLDLAYQRADFDRFLIARGTNPTDLELASGSDGRRIAFDRPFPYALYLAPFVKLWPARGPALANALLLVLACVVAARTLERRAGGWAPLQVTVLTFASVIFVYAFFTTGDLFLFTLAILGFCALLPTVAPAAGRLDEIYAPDAPESAGAVSRRWLLGGALLAVPAATEPLYALLLLAALFMAPAGERAPARWALVVGAGGMLAAIVAVHWLAGGGLYAVATSRFRFTPETGYPLVDFTAGEWGPAVRRLDALSWEGAPRFAWGVDPRLWGWSGLYLVVGRSIGLVPYFAPLVLLGRCGSLRGFGRPIAVAAALWLAAIVILRPFNVYGGEGAVGNRLFLPIYGALWLLLAHPPQAHRPSSRRSSRAPFAIVVSVLLAAPFLWKLWLEPWAYPITAGEGYRHATAAARRVLPYETSQKPMPGGQAAEHNGLWVKFLNERAWAETRRRRLMVEGAGPVEMMVASTLPLAALRLEFGKDAPSQIELDGGELDERVLRADGGISFRVVPRGLERRHPTWWTPNVQHVYLLRFELPQAPEKDLAFTLVGERIRS